MNRHTLPQDEVERHLLMKGMSTTYTRWINHGEPIKVHVLEEPVHHDGNANSLVTEDTNDGGFDGMLRDLVGSEHVNDDEHEDGNPSNAAASHFKHLIEEAKRGLYLGCTNFSRLSFVIKLLHVKSYYRITN